MKYFKTFFLVCIFLVANASYLRCQYTTYPKLDSLISILINESNYDVAGVLMDETASLSIEEARQAYSRLVSLDKDKSEPLACSILAHVFFYQGQLDSSLHYYMWQGQLAENRGDYVVASSGYGNAAYVLGDMDMTEAAISLMKGKQALAESSPDPRDLSDYFYNLSTFYYTAAQIDSAVIYLEKCMEIDAATDNKKGMLANKRRLADFLIYAKDWTQAKVLCRELIKDAHTQNELRSLAGGYYRLGIVYDGSTIDPDSLRLGLENIKNAISTDVERGDSTRICDYLAFKGRLNSKLKQQTQAREAFEEAVYTANKFSTKSKQLNCYTQLIQFLLIIGDKKGALYNLKHALELSENNVSYQSRSRLLEIQADLAKQNGDFETMANALQENQKLIDKRVEGELKQATLNSARILEIRKMQSLNDQLRAEKDSAQAKARSRYILFGISFALFCMSLGVGYLLYRQQKQKELLLKKDGEERVLQLNNKLLRKELTALKLQINPHFLFNSLSSIKNFIMYEDPKSASKYLTKFSHLMRNILNNSKQNLITISDEIKTLQLYTELENLRFENRFDISIKSEGLDIERCYIPTMVIQPYIENAILHGLVNKVGGGRLKVVFFKSTDNTISISITDDGIGRKAAMAIKAKKTIIHKSMGMEITEDRIKLLKDVYGIDGKVEIKDLYDSSGNAGGTEVNITLPYINNMNKPDTNVLN